MRTTFAAVILFAGIAAAQSFTLGSADDPCTGGTAYSVAGGALQTLRFSSLPFSCAFQATGNGGLYRIELDFVEPSAFVPASDPNGRLFNVTVTDGWGSQQYGALSNVDLYTMGGTSPATVVSRTVLAFSSDGKFSINLTTIKRSAVISRVLIMPYTPTFDLSSYALKTDVPAAPDMSSYALKTDLAGYLPYKGATQDLDVGQYRIYAGGLTTNGTSPQLGYLYMAQASAVPTTATNPADGRNYYAVFYIDPTDGVPRLYTPQGTFEMVKSTQPIARATCVSTGKVDCGQIDLYTFPLRDGTKRQQLAIPPTPQALAIPPCPATPSCWKPAAVDQ